MSMGKEVEILGEGSSVSAELSLGRKDKVTAGIWGCGFAIGIPGISFLATAERVMAEFATDPGQTALILGGLTALTSISGLIFNKLIQSDAIEAQIADTFFPREEGYFYRINPVRKKITELKKTGEGRILVKSFHVKHTSELDISTWQSSKHKVAELNATHTINQYLVKEKGGFRAEQEVIANPETIWDLFAEALVEVYGVQEKTDTMKRITA